MKNQLYLHEAIVVALINIDKETFSATFDEIAAFIDKRDLFPNRKAGCTMSEQVMLRATQAKGYYRYLFHRIDDQTIQLKSFPLIKKKPAKTKVVIDGVDLSAYTKDKKTIAKLKKNEQII
jgi:hypothetical protein